MKDRIVNTLEQHYQAIIAKHKLNIDKLSTTFDAIYGSYGPESKFFKQIK